MNGKIFQRLNGQWINRNQYLIVKEFNSNYYYYTEIPVEFSDAEPVQVWKINYTPTSLTGKWNLHFWKDDLNRDDFFGGIVDFNVLLDPWFHTSANARIPITVTAPVVYDLNTTWFIKGFDSSGFSGNNSRLWLVRQDINVALDIDIEGVFGIDSDLNIAFKVPDFIFPIGSPLNGTDSNGLMLYIEDEDVPRSTFIQYRDLNQVYWFGDNFDTNTLGQDYNIQTDANWNDAGFIRIRGTQSEDFVSRLIGISSPTNIILQSRQRSSEVGGGGICLNALNSSVSERAHCLANISDIIFREPNVANRTDTGINSVINEWFTYFLVEYSDSNVSGTAINTNAADLNTSNLMPSSNYENFGITNEPNFTDLSNIHFDIVTFGGADSQVDVDWFKVFKFVSPASITIGSQQNLTNKLQVTFKDENSGDLINPTTVNISINDSDFNSWADNVVNGLLDINLATFSSGKWIIVFADATHPARTFTQDVNNQAGQSFTLGMLNDTNGLNLNFKFFDQNGSNVLVDANIEVRDSLNRIAEKKSTGSDGLITFFLNPNDLGYKFNINDANGSDYNYTATQVTVKIPLDERDLSLITAFDIKKRGIGAQDINAVSIDTNVAIYANTIDFYQIIVGDENGDYFDRSYFFNLKGQVSQVTLQPYLVTNEVDVGAEIVITTKDRFTRETLPNVLLDVKKQIPGNGIVTVEIAETDDSGRAQIAVVLGDEYTIDANFIQADGTVLTFRKTLRIIDSDGFTYGIDTGAVIDTNMTQEGFTVTYNIIDNFVSLVDGNYNIKVDVNSSLNNISDVAFVIKNSLGTTLIYRDFNSVSGTNFTSFDVNLASSVDKNVTYFAEVIITDTNGVIYNNPLFKAFELDRGSVSGALFKNIGSMFNDFLGERLSLFLLVVIAAFSTGGITRFTGNQDVQVMFAASLMGLFALIGGLDWGLWFFVTTPMLFLMLVRTRGIGRG